MTTATASETGGGWSGRLPIVLLLTVMFVVLVCGSPRSASAQDPAVQSPPGTEEVEPVVSQSDSSGSATADAQRSVELDEQAKPDEQPKPNEQARRSYLGRVVAAPMSHLGAPWLVRPERDEEERSSESFQQLKLADGMTVCDLGCGNGYWTLPMARDVAPQGRVLAVDIQPEMLRKLRERTLRSKLDNVEPILGKIDDPQLPVGSVDLVLMVDVYHEFSHPESMLWGIRRSLTSTGVVALLEYRQEDPTVPIKKLHKMSKAQIMKEYTANGFKLVREYNSLPWQHLMFFARDDSPLEKIEPLPTQQVLSDLK